MGIYRNPRGRPQKGHILQYQTLEESREKAVFQKKLKKILELHKQLIPAGICSGSENQCITQILPNISFNKLYEFRKFVNNIPNFIYRINEIDKLKRLEKILMFWVSIQKQIRNLRGLSQQTYISNAERDFALNNDGFLNSSMFRKQLTGDSKMPFDPVYSAWYSKGN